MAEFDDIIDVLNNGDDYLAEEMAEYTIDDITYSGYSEYSFIWEKTYVKQIERSKDGSMGNLDTYATFIIPRMTVTYSLMTINDYRSIMKQFLEKNEFDVTCYDPIHNEKITRKMYFATPSAPKFWTQALGDGKVELLGVQNYTVELIGTNNDKKYDE